MQIDNPYLTILFLGLFVGFAVVYPLLKSERFQVTPARLVALLFAVGLAIWFRSLMILIGCLWPLSLNWFPEYWGNYTGFLQGGYIDQKSPPVVVALMGWMLLACVPLMFYGISLAR